MPWQTHQRHFRWTVFTGIRGDHVEYLNLEGTPYCAFVVCVCSLFVCVCVRICRVCASVVCAFVVCVQFILCAYICTSLFFACVHVLCVGDRGWFYV